MNNKPFVLIAAGALLTTLPALAHHSTAVFDKTKDIALTGTIKKFEWTNPHVWIWLTIPQADGTEQTWGFESAAPVQLRRAGFTWESFKIGDKLTLNAHPLRSGQPGGQFVSARFADGRVLNSPDPAAKANEEFQTVSPTDNP